MKIAIWHNLPSGGGKRALYDQVRGLLARGHHIESWCPTTADQSYLPLSELITEHILPIERPTRTDWDRRLRIPGRVEAPLAGMEAHCAACADAIAAGGFDILYAHCCPFFAVTPIGRLVPLAKALYLQEPFRVLYEAMPTLPWVAPPPPRPPITTLDGLRKRALEQRELHNVRIQAREERRNAAAYDRIFVNSLFSRESVLRCYGLDAEVCYLGTDVDRFTDRGWPRENLLVGLGSFTPWKNLELAIEAVALLPPPRPTLAWIGNATVGTHLQDMIALAAARGVPFTPHMRIPDEEIVNLLNRASALVYAPRLEPFGYAVLEAAACGLPVVGVAEGGLRETVIDGETGILVPNSPSDMANAIARLLADPVLVRRMGVAAGDNARQRWSLDAATDRIEHALQRVVAGHHVASTTGSR